MKNKMTVVILLMAYFFTLFSNVSVSAENDIKVVLNGTALEFDVPPQIIDGRTMVPMRAIFEALDAWVEWIDKEYEITEIIEGMIRFQEVYKDEKDYEFQNTEIYDWVADRPVIRAEISTFDSIGLQIGSLAMVIQKGFVIHYIALDVPPQIIDGRTLVPARAVSEALGVEVEWDETAMTVILSCDKEFIESGNADETFHDDVMSWLTGADYNTQLSEINNATSVNINFFGDGFAKLIEDADTVNELSDIVSSMKFLLRDDPGIIPRSGVLELTFYSNNNILDRLSFYDGWVYIEGSGEYYTVLSDDSKLYYLCWEVCGDPFGAIIPQNVLTPQEETYNLLETLEAYSIIREISDKVSFVEETSGINLYPILEKLVEDEKFVEATSEGGIVLKECKPLLELLQKGNLTPADQASIFLLLVETEVRYRAKEEIYISERKHECEKIVFFSFSVWAANSQLRDLW